MASLLDELAANLMTTARDRGVREPFCAMPNVALLARRSRRCYVVIAAMSGEGGPMMDPERFYAMRDEFDRAARRYEGSADDDGEQRGTDTTGKVEARRASTRSPWSVTIHPHWSDVVEVRMLGAAVLEAIEAASVDATRRWAESVASDRGDRATTPVARFADTPAGHLDQALRDRPELVETEAMLERLVKMVTDLADNLDETLAMAAAGTAAAVIGGSDAVQVHARHPQILVGVHYDPKWLQLASSEEISRRTSDAIAEALGAAARQPSPLAGTPLERYGRILDDPDAMTRLMLGEVW